MTNGIDGIESAMNIPLYKRFLDWWWAGLRAPFVKSAELTPTELGSLKSGGKNTDYVLRVPEHSQFLLESGPAPISDVTALAASKLPFAENELYVCPTVDESRIFAASKAELDQFIQQADSGGLKLAGLRFSEGEHQATLTLSQPRMPMWFLAILAIAFVCVFFGAHWLNGEQINTIRDTKAQLASPLGQADFIALPAVRTASTVADQLSVLAKALEPNTRLTQLTVHQDQITLDISAPSILDLISKLEAETGPSSIEVIGNIIKANEAPLERSRLQVIFE